MKKRKRHEKAGSDFLKIDKDIKKDIEGVGNIRRNLDAAGKQLDKEVEDVENWVLARRKFFIKLGWVLLLIIILIMITYYLPQ